MGNEEEEFLIELEKVKCEHPTLIFEQQANPKKKWINHLPMRVAVPPYFFE
jgi:hypothetical protein